MVIGWGCHGSSEKLTQPTASGLQLAVCGQLLPLAYIWWEAWGHRQEKRWVQKWALLGIFFHLYAEDLQWCNSNSQLLANSPFGQFELRTLWRKGSWEMSSLL